VWQYFKLPAMYKPVFFIFLVVLAPGISEAMFYYQSNVLHFDAQTFALLNTLSAAGSIVGVILYRVCLKSMSFKKVLIVTTFGFSLTQSLNLFVSAQTTMQFFHMSASLFSMVISLIYSIVGELHLMPLMVLAC